MKVVAPGTKVILPDGTPAVVVENTGPRTVRVYAVGPKVLRFPPGDLKVAGKLDPATHAELDALYAAGGAYLRSRGPKQ